MICIESYCHQAHPHSLCSPLLTCSCHTGLLVLLQGPMLLLPQGLCTCSPRPMPESPLTLINSSSVLSTLVPTLSPAFRLGSDTQLALKKCRRSDETGLAPGSLPPFHYSRETEAQKEAATAEPSWHQAQVLGTWWGRLRKPPRPPPQPQPPRRARLERQRPGQIEIDRGEQLGRVEQTRGHWGAQGRPGVRMHPSQQWRIV